jgi:hypothetical protein
MGSSTSDEQRWSLDWLAHHLSRVPRLGLDHITRLARLAVPAAVSGLSRNRVTAGALVTAGWVNLKQRAEQLRAAAKHDREAGYSDGYALLRAKSVSADYQAGWRRGRQARLDFDWRNGAA